jgi:hypothetical protein
MGVISNAAEILTDVKTQIKNNIYLVHSTDTGGRPGTYHDYAPVLLSEKNLNGNLCSTSHVAKIQTDMKTQIKTFVWPTVQIVAVRPGGHFKCAKMQTA